MMDGIVSSTMDSDMMAVECATTVVHKQHVGCCFAARCFLNATLLLGEESFYSILCSELHGKESGPVTPHARCP